MITKSRIIQLEDCMEEFSASTAAVFEKYQLKQTTKGTVIFDEQGRRTSRKARACGSEIRLTLVCRADEHEEMIKQAARFIAPESMAYSINGIEMVRLSPEKTIARKCLKTTLTRIGGSLVSIALNEPEFFKV